MASSTKALRIGGEGRVAEVDGAYFGGHMRPRNLTADRVDRRLLRTSRASGRSSADGDAPAAAARTLAQVFPAEADAVTTIRRQIAKGTIVHADEISARNPLHASFVMQQINHQDGYSIDSACTNWRRVPTFPGCVAVKLDIITISPDPILSDTPRKRPGVKISAGQAMGSR